jgi:hypothetical protein
VDKPLAERFNQFSPNFRIQPKGNQGGYLIDLQSYQKGGINTQSGISHRIDKVQRASNRKISACAYANLEIMIIIRTLPMVR